MSNQSMSSQFQEVIEKVEALPLEDQAMLLEVLQKRTLAGRRRQLGVEIAEARRAYSMNAVFRGTPADLMREMDE